ncbi:hypothetical protein BH10BAC2_BH10BAC2_25760 [soil metagenome]
MANLVQAQVPTLFFREISKDVLSPVAITNAGDGTGRLFIAEAGGTIKIYKNGSVLAKPFLNIAGSFPDQIISGIAFHPKYAKNRKFFVYTYNVLNTTITLRSYTASTSNPDSAVLNSGKILFTKTSPSPGSHHVMGDLHFDKDGYLYISVGDGSPINGTNNQAQDGQLFFGKMLRIDVNEPNPPYYKIPPDNPFVNDPNVLDEIWSISMRNAWRWSFDRKTSDLWLADVGKDTWEEVNFMASGQNKGVNFGWSCYQGNAEFNTTGCSAKSNYTFPIFTYAHESLGENSVIGGFVYRGIAFPQLKGYYVCADYNSGEAWKIKANASGGWKIKKQANVPKSIAGFGEGEDGELYAIAFDSSKIYQVQTTASFAIDDGIATEINMTGAKALKSTIFPTLINNSSIIIDLKETHKFARLIDMGGRELMRRTLPTESGRITLQLPKLQPGMYIIQLVGKYNLQQKIYVTR